LETRSPNVNRIVEKTKNTVVTYNDEIIKPWYFSKSDGKTLSFLDYCIKNKLKLFEPGAQGEHKVARGFLPTKTQSFHWLNNSPFQKSIEQYVEHEKMSIEHYIQSIPSPYKNTE
jgi:hypothetical protein